MSVNAQTTEYKLVGLSKPRSAKLEFFNIPAETFDCKFCFDDALWDYCKNNWDTVNLKAVVQHYGFEACEYVNKSYRDHDDPEKYWWFRCYQSEVEWVCNVVSAVLFNEGQPPILSHLPTCNAMQKAHSILSTSK